VRNNNVHRGAHRRWTAFPSTQACGVGVGFSFSFNIDSGCERHVLEKLDPHTPSLPWRRKSASDSVDGFAMPQPARHPPSVIRRLLSVSVSTTARDPTTAPLLPANHAAMPRYASCSIANDPRLAVEPPVKLSTCHCDHVRACHAAPALHFLIAPFTHPVRPRIHPLNWGTASRHALPKSPSTTSETCCP
jgi:hypothetical protein